MILRSLMLFLSEQKQLRKWFETSRLARPLTRRFIAGQTLEDALGLCVRLRQEGTLSSLDRLGESVTSPGEVEASRDGYLEAVARVGALELPATFSVKLTLFGLDLSEDLCRRHVEPVLAEAKAHGKVVEVDMESSAHVDRTLRLVTDWHEKYGNVRAVIQAYLYRSAEDVAMLCERRIPVRLCKGAYKEPATVAYPSKRAVRESFARLMETLLVRGVYPGFATHDVKLIARAKRLARERGMGPGGFEFQMLYGIRRDLEKQFLAEGYRLRLYVPYGEHWYPYFMRRLAEHPANLVLVLRSLLKG
jgi:proline dehydrogenase